MLLKVCRKETTFSAFVHYEVVTDFYVENIFKTVERHRENIACSSKDESWCLERIHFRLWPTEESCYPISMEMVTQILGFNFQYIKHVENLQSTTAVLWGTILYITPCSPLKINHLFSRNIWPCALMLVSCSTYFPVLNMDQYSSPKH
jgi:hypothetical protein